MRFDRFTLKAQEAVQEAQELAEGSGHPEIGPFHLLGALVSQDQGIVGPILERLGADPRAIGAAVRERLDGIGRVEGGADPGPSRELVSILKESDPTWFI